MYNMSIRFQSPALTQAKLFNRNNFNNLENVTKENIANISTIPNFNDSYKNGRSALIDWEYGYYDPIA